MRVGCGNCRHRKEQEAGEESSGLPVTSGTRRPQVRDRLTDGSKVSIRRTPRQTQTTTHSTPLHSTTGYRANASWFFSFFRQRMMVTGRRVSALVEICFNISFSLLTILTWLLALNVRILPS